MTIISDFRTYGGKHCETTATGCLLLHENIKISEPMMLGLSQGFGFIYWKMNFMNLPFIGGRAKPFDLTRVFCSNMNIKLDERETTSKKKAWQNLSEFIENGVPVGLQVDCYHLEHFKHSFHFAGHFISIYGYDNDYAYIYDTGKKYKVSLENLEKARFEKGPMSAKALSYTVKKKMKMTPIVEIIPKALHEVATGFLNPPLKCFGYMGIEKLGKEMLNWLKCTPNPKTDLLDQADMMENAGTGGAIFRNFYRDYLYECLDFFPGNARLSIGANLYKDAANNWTEIARLIKKTAENEEIKYLEKASEICLDTAKIEKEAMQHLLSI
ncbi:MAG: lantibiotic ABC transporter [Chloroflexi bacterium HGW-Chloroflexi-5]|jgi:hypothetical protein|nr:MAG: lantibiotic ABC transporter [Chloroflexi bacterium HGW-Chloroflexi-5]